MPSFWTVERSSPPLRVVVELALMGIRNGRARRCTRPSTPWAICWRCTLLRPMNQSTLKGSCLCGAVKFEVSGEPRLFFHCHCSRCRKLTGTGHASNMFFQPGVIKWLKGEEQIRGFKLPEAKRGFVLLPRRWVVERSFGWAARFRRLARDYERLAMTLTGYHWLAFAMLMLTSVFGKS